MSIKEKSGFLFSKERLEMFSDGVFAIAITLLVLEIKIPGHEAVAQAGGLYQYLLKIWPSYLAYFVSFFIIGIYWSNHNHLFKFIVKRTNHYFNLINVLFLMTISFLPFCTAIFSEFILEKEQYGAAVSSYITGLILPQLSLIIMIYYGKNKKGILDAALKDSFMNKQIMKLLAALATNLVALAFSFYFPTISIIIMSTSFFLYFLPPDVPEYKEGVKGEKSMAEKELTIEVRPPRF